MLPEVEKKNQRIGMGVSIGIHGLLLILFFLIMAWREPDPPVPEYGIELNFGLEAVGSGEIQPEQPSATPQLIEEQIISEEIIEEPAEEMVEELPVEEIPEQQEPEIIEEQIIDDSEMEDSPDVIPVETQPETPVEQEVEEEIVEETTTEPEEEEIVEDQPVARNDNASETVVDGQGTSEEADSDAETTSHGDDVDVARDKGDEQGVIDERGLYSGTYGGGGGPILDLTGWIWESKPNVDDNSNEVGKIVFEIKIDERGEIFSVKTLERTVTQAVVNTYKAEIELLTFRQTTNTPPAPVSTGRITFIIKEKAKK